MIFSRPYKKHSTTSIDTSGRIVGSGRYHPLLMDEVPKGDSNGICCEIETKYKKYQYCGYLIGILNIFAKKYYKSIGL